MILSFYEDNISSEMQQQECWSSQPGNLEKVGREGYLQCKDNTCVLNLKGEAVMDQLTRLHFFKVWNEALAYIVYNNLSFQRFENSSFQIKLAFKAQQQIPFSPRF